jgi:CYTH domain-containing protein
MASGSEIERKFLVADPPEDLEDWPASRIEQGYLAVTDVAEVRIRRRGGPPGAATLTVKSAPGLTRAEEELALEPAAFERLWPLTEGRRVCKVRRVREIAPGVVLELDVYEGALAGLLTLEVEFADADAAGRWSPPPWVGEDVTGDAAYANQTLALRGLPER